MIKGVDVPEAEELGVDVKTAIVPEAASVFVVVELLVAVGDGVLVLDGVAGHASRRRRLLPLSVIQIVPSLAQAAP